MPLEKLVFIISHSVGGVNDLNSFKTLTGIKVMAYLVIFKFMIKLLHSFSVTGDKNIEYGLVVTYEIGSIVFCGKLFSKSWSIVE